jgi:hypothetical protein
VGAPRFELVDVIDNEISTLQQVPNESGAESGALGAQFGDFPPELVEVVSAWPNLSKAVREEIVAMVQEAAK